MRQKLKYTLLPLLWSLFILQAHTQQSHLDSALQLLAEARQENGLDTLKFYKARDIIQSFAPGDDQILLLEAAGAKLNSKGSEALTYLVKYYIFNALISHSTENRALAYGLKNIKELESAKWPYAIWIKNYFINQIRLPYRKSERLDEGIRYISQKIVDAKIIKDSLTLASSYYVLAGFYYSGGLIDQAKYNIQMSISYLDTLKTNDLIFFNMNNPIGRSRWLNHIQVLGWVCSEAEEHEKALEIFSFAKKRIVNPVHLCSNLLFSIQTLLIIDSLTLIPGLLQKIKLDTNYMLTPLNRNAVLQAEACYMIKMSAYQKAEEILDECIRLANQYKLVVDPGSSFKVIPHYYYASLRMAQGRYNEALTYLEENLVRVVNARNELIKNYKLQAELYIKIGKPAQAADALFNYIRLQDETLKKQIKLRKSSFEIEQEIKAREFAISRLENENKIAGLTRNFTFGLAIFLLIIALLAYKRYISKQRDNQLLSTTLSNLKSTQAQLIQSEKMASLGELTAGIAHEIQNPINFVNNFSELNIELVYDLKKEINLSNMDEAQDILNNLESNQQKIVHHGKRADIIVKGMLEHSRTNKGEKILTNLNDLAEQYLLLSYHGLLAKNKYFKAEYKTETEIDLPLVNVVPQDMGRVFLNIFNNAFYEVNEYSEKPCVTLSTQRKDGVIEITVADNGPGISETIKDKIFQPFFTTKPTGQGTGLGLSLSYNIVKAYGGELKVESKEGEGSKFIIILPVEKFTEKA